MIDEYRVERNVDRFNAFFDGVVVISMTLLILNVELPDTPTSLDGAELVTALKAMGPKYFGYVLSFLVIAQYWLGYSHTFGRVKRIDGGYVWLSILFLLCIGFLPFSTSLISEHDGLVSTLLYAAMMVVISVILAALRFYANAKGLTEPKLSRGETWRAVGPWLQVIAVFGGSMVVAIFDTGIAKLCWLLLVVPFGWLWRRKAA